MKPDQPPLYPVAAFLTMLAVVLALVSPGTLFAAAMGYDDARHLLVRTGFGPTDAEIRAVAALSREQAVTQILRDVRTTATLPPPAWTSEVGPLRPPRGADASDEDRRAFLQLQARHGIEMKGWWIRQMLVTPSPFTERMTLFWHNHFVSSQQKVRVAQLMFEQNLMLRSHAVGNFGDLLRAAAKDPAMLVYLDGAQNRRGAPNENFAREVMELFTLGEGKYSEQDVKEAARAFTGWSIDRETGRYLYRPAFHDRGSKSVLGRTGALDGDAVITLLLAQPATATHITAKLWKEFVSPESDPREVARIAQLFRGQNYDIKVALRALLMSEAFWAKDNRGTLVKSPVELVVGTLRQLDVAPDNAAPFALLAASMGQNIFAPPNVKGWPGGEAWIDSSTLLARKQFLDRLTRGDEMPVAMQTAMADNDAATDQKKRAERYTRAVDRGMRMLHFDATAWVARQPGATPNAKLVGIQTLLLPLAATAPESTEAGDSMAFVRATLLDPAYQLK